MEKLFEVASTISTPLGIAGLIAATTFLIFRQIIKKNIFPTLTKNLSADIIRLIIKQLSILTIISMVLGFAGFVLSIIYKQPSVGSMSPGSEELTFVGRVIDAKTALTITGAKISVTAQEKLLTGESDSKGVFVIKLNPPVPLVDLRVAADNYVPYFEHTVPTDRVKEISLSRVDTSNPSQSPINVNRASNNTSSNAASISPDRNLSGVEISFKPSTQHWAAIVRAYDKIPSPVRSIPISGAPFLAERVRDYWLVDFGPVKSREGTLSLPSISTDRESDKAFEEVIGAALINLWIAWGNGIETTIDPRRLGYPAAIAVSQEKIVIILRPPDLILSLNNLMATPMVTFRGQSYPNDIRIRSLDPGVIFDQTINLKWKEARDDTHFARMNPYLSGPHKLDVSFTQATSAPASVISNTQSFNEKPPQKTDQCDCGSCGNLICCPNPGMCVPCGECGQVCCNK